MHWILGHTAEDLGVEIAVNETHINVFCFRSLKMKELDAEILSLVFHSLAKRGYLAWLWPYLFIFVSMCHLGKGQFDQN